MYWFISCCNFYTQTNTAIFHYDKILLPATQIQIFSCTAKRLDQQQWHWDWPTASRSNDTWRRGNARTVRGLLKPCHHLLVTPQTSATMHFVTVVKSFPSAVLSLSYWLTDWFNYTSLLSILCWSQAQQILVKTTYSMFIILFVWICYCLWQRRKKAGLTQALILKIPWLPWL